MGASRLLVAGRLACCAAQPKPLIRSTGCLSEHVFASLLCRSDYHTNYDRLEQVCAGGRCQKLGNSRIAIGAHPLLTLFTLPCHRRLWRSTGTTSAEPPAKLPST